MTALKKKPTHPNNAGVIAVVSVTGLLIIVLAVYTATAGIGARPAASQTQPSAMVSTPVASAGPPVAYKDGSYSAPGDYRAPSGPETVGVSITLQNGVIADATVTPQAQSFTSMRYQNMFVAGYKTQVVGKKLSDVKLDTVSGASLTTRGFNTALEAIKAQAKS